MEGEGSFKKRHYRGVTWVNKVRVWTVGGVKERGL